MPEESPGSTPPVVETTGQIEGERATAFPPAGTGIVHEMPPFGKRFALSELRRTLTEEELKNPGVIKLILDELARVDTECDSFRGYVDRFHDADKKAAVLEEKQKAVTSIEIAYGVGMALGGAVIGLSPSFWGKESQGIIALVVGAVLIIGAAIMRLKKG